jgi:cation diffusion facilitator CzcD-associated flavoprotein CzcO
MLENGTSSHQPQLRSRLALRTRQRVAVVASGRSAVTMLSRAKSAGCESVALFDRTGDLLAQENPQQYTVVIALLEPHIITREDLHALDSFGMRTIGVVGHHRHRTWAALLPLNEAVWLFAPPKMYRRQMMGLDRALAGESTD